MNVRTFFKRCHSGGNAAGQQCLAGPTPKNADEDRIWFGVTNWYYEIGDTGILVDGVVSKLNHKNAPSDLSLVGRVFKAIDIGAGVDSIFIGHEHDDHSFDAVA